MMGTIEYVDVATAKTARGVRMVVSGLVPSPWSESAKGLFRLAGIDVRAVTSGAPDAEIASWSRADNVPVVMYDDEPPRTGWAPILQLAVRLGAPGVLVPDEVDGRARVFGLVHELAGENGVGWEGRLLGIDCGITSGGTRGFPLPVSQYLAAKYGYRPGCADAARARIHAVLAALAHELGDRAFFHGPGPGALDVYSATFLTPLREVTEEDCPGCHPALRGAFGSTAEALGGAIPDALLAHRTRMFAGHLAWPILLGPPRAA